MMFSDSKSQGTLSQPGIAHPSALRFVAELKQGLKQKSPLLKFLRSLRLALILLMVLLTALVANMDGIFTQLGWNIENRFLKIGACILAGALALEVLFFLLRRGVLREESYEARLQMMNRFMDDIINHGQFGVQMVDLNGQIVRINQHFEQILGLSPTGEYNLFQDENFYTTGVMEEIKKAFRGETVVLRYLRYHPGESRQYPSGKGRESYVNLTCIPMRDEFSHNAGIIMIFEDITENLRLQDQLLQAQKMGTIGTLTGGLVHDFNNILGSVLGYTTFLKQKTKATDWSYRYLEAVEQSTRRATTLARQLLNFARGGMKAEMRPIDLNECITNTLQLIESSMDKKIRVVQELKPGLMAIQGNMNRVEQATMNLCLNARDAMPKGGILRLITNEVVVKAVGQVGVPPILPVGPYAVVSIIDTGTGMDEKTRQRLAQPFFSTKATGKGTGLGLSMVFNIVKEHGGHVEISSELGKGTRFDLYFKGSLRTLVAEVKDAVPSPIKGGNEKVLIVDDEEILRMMAEEILKEQGYTVYTACDGLEAQEVFRQHYHEIDLVLMDMMMPNCNGVDAYRALREIRPDVRTVFTSGYADSDLVKHLSDIPTARTLQKPYSAEVLVREVRKFLDQRN